MESLGGRTISERIGVTLVVLALFIASVASWKYHNPLEIGLLITALVTVCISARSFELVLRFFRLNKQTTSSVQE